MNKAETVQIITLITLSYPSTEKLDDETIDNMLNIWGKFFEDDPYNLVEMAVLKHIATNKWMPSIAEIRQEMARLKRPDLIPPTEAWKIVSDYMFVERDFIGGVDEALPPLIAQTIKTLTLSELKQNDRGRQMFYDFYTTAYERELERAMLPKSLRMRIENAENAIAGEARKKIARIEQVRKEREDDVYKKYRYLEIEKKDESS